MNGVDESFVDEKCSMNNLDGLLSDLDEWLALLEQRHPKEIDLGLERIAAVAQRATIGKPAPRVVTVAGTNGKGSCVATLASILRAAGLRVGVYTSPHLIRYNERIVLPDGAASDQSICDSFARIEQARDGISLTYFEFGTLAAFDLMARAHCDVAVLEVGLGGRLDAVNLVDADIAVITAIDLDHQDWLGDSRDRIGVEKAGIARPGRPLLVADPEPPAAMLARLQEVGAHVWRLGQDFGLEQEGGLVAKTPISLSPAIKYLDVRLRGIETNSADDTSRSLRLKNPPVLPLPSVLCALQAAWLLDQDGRIARAVHKQLPDVEVAGRWQRLRWRDRDVLLDVAHNPAAARLLARCLSQSSIVEQLPATEPASAARSTSSQQNAQPIYHGVCAIMADKDLEAIIQPLAGVLASLEAAELPDMPRATRAADLAAVASRLGVATSCSATPEEAFEAAVSRAGCGESVLVFGSFFIVGPVLRYISGIARSEAS